MTEFWFKRKRFGWGLQPCSKEGWFMTAGLIGVFLVLGVVMGEELVDLANIWEYYALLIIILFVFIFFADKKATKPLIFKQNQHVKQQ